MAISKTICILDSDPCFSSLLITRLQKQLPDVLAFHLNMETLLSRRDLLLDNNYVLYNQQEISKEELLRHCSKERMPRLITLLSEEKPYPPKDVLMLVHEIEDCIGLGTIPLPVQGKIQTCLVLSFVSPAEREVHIRKLLTSARLDFPHIIRLDIMPGILMESDPEIAGMREASHVDGISVLLDKIRMGGLSYKEIPSYLEPDPYGDLRFGKPIHSDDIISAHTRTILSVINRSVRYLRTLETKGLLLLVADGLSFKRMQTLSQNASHLEILTPLNLEKDYLLCREIDTLVKSHRGTSHVDFPFSIQAAGTGQGPHYAKKTLVRSHL